MRFNSTADSVHYEVAVFRMSLVSNSPLIKTATIGSYATWTRDNPIHKNRLYVLTSNDPAPAKLPVNVAIVSAHPTKGLDKRVVNAAADLIEANIRVARLSDAFASLQKVLRQNQVKSPTELIDELYSRGRSKTETPLVWSKNGDLELLMQSSNQFIEPRADDEIDVLVERLKDFKPPVVADVTQNTIVLVEDVKQLYAGQLQDTQHVVYVAFGSDAGIPELVLAIKDGLDWFSYAPDFQPQTTLKSLEGVRKQIRDNLPVA